MKLSKVNENPIIMEILKSSFFNCRLIRGKEEQSKKENEELIDSEEEINTSS